MNSHGPSRVVMRLPPSSSTNTSRKPCSTKKHSSTSWVCAAFAWPGSTYMIESVKFPAITPDRCLEGRSAGVQHCLDIETQALERRTHILGIVQRVGKA